MSTDFQIDAEVRNHTGKGDARRLRHQDQIPAIIYGAEKDPQSIVLEHKNIQKLLNNEAAYSHVLTVAVNGKKEQVILKAIQRHAYKPMILHVDFMRIKSKEAITMKTQIHFLNEDNCPAIKQGGVLSKLMTDLEIKCLPTDLPESIDIDLTNVEMDQTLHLSDIQLPKGVTFASGELDEEHNLAVASIHKPKASATTEADSAEESSTDSEEAKGEE